MVLLTHQISESYVVISIPKAHTGLSDVITQSNQTCNHCFQTYIISAHSQKNYNNSIKHFNIHILKFTTSICL
ncbi:hypothetical protein F383_38234 [Gossypium arboreum]|uniref:Uncharacterized protein n=1 Tax=Gossypium arboreum TaxID=29729 RepID=A0A0B0MJI9_GOSAR|nr:hypothetical protein F383_38234 [Gossypium arboreum]